MKSPFSRQGYAKSIFGSYKSWDIATIVQIRKIKCLIAVWWYLVLSDCSGKWEKVRVTTFADPGKILTKIWQMEQWQMGWEQMCISGGGENGFENWGKCSGVTCGAICRKSSPCKSWRPTKSLSNFLPVEELHLVLIRSQHYPRICSDSFHAKGRCANFLLNLVVGAKYIWQPFSSEVVSVPQTDCWLEIAQVQTAKKQKKKKSRRWKFPPIDEPPTSSNSFAIYFGDLW